MRIALFLCLLAGPALHFDITDARGRKPPGVSIEYANPDDDGWYDLTPVSKSKTEYALVWPFDSKAAAPDGPEPIPVTAIPVDDQKSLAAARIVAYRAAAELLRSKGLSGVDVSGLASSSDSFARGVELLYKGNNADAVEPLARALRERENQLTRIPSEIYPAAMLYGRALFASGKFDDAAVAYMKAMKQRPSDPVARKARAEALIKAGKPEAARELIVR